MIIIINTVSIIIIIILNLFSFLPVSFTISFLVLYLIRLCNYFYRYRLTNVYNDLAEEAKLECQDGCEIALQICQAGYYCNDGNNNNYNGDR
jgi:hypothetical protein